MAAGFDDLCYKGKRFNSPNDVVVHRDDGSTWFTDPIYGLLETKRYTIFYSYVAQSRSLLRDMAC